MQVSIRRPAFGLNLSLARRPPLTDKCHLIDKPYFEAEARIANGLTGEQLQSHIPASASSSDVQIIELSEPILFHFPLIATYATRDNTPGFLLELAGCTCSFDLRNGRFP